MKSSRRSRLSRCIDFLPDGRLLLVDSARRRLLRREPDGTLLPHADLLSLADKPWNDIVADYQGRAYVNSIGFEFPGGEFAPGLIALVTADGEVRQVAGDLAFPNGMAITPDGHTLIVAESYANRLTAFDIDADGGLGNRRVWAETPGDHPDGICLDAEAAWYADVGSKRCVRVREGGEVLATADLDRGAFACVLSRGDDPVSCSGRPAWLRTASRPAMPVARSAMRSRSTPEEMTEFRPRGRRRLRAVRRLPWWR
jgi:sugar lactone lactonase YvrE